MKNAIRYYYNLYVENIRQMEKQYRFTIEKENFILSPIDISIEEANEIYQLSEQLNRNGILCHQVVLNQQNQVVTLINQTAYILLKMHFYKPEQIILNDNIYLTKYALEPTKNGILKRGQWYSLWTNKIDYLEYQVSQFGKKFPIIRESFGYYVGLSETAITLLQHLDVKEVPLYVTHRRIHRDQTVIEFYNPTTFVIDTRVRDTSEYFKMRYFQNIPVLEEIQLYMKNSNLTEDEKKLFFCRMIFPTYYFDLYEQIISGEIPEKKLLDMISKVTEYEEFLRDLYYILAIQVKLPDIEWFHKKM